MATTGQKLLAAGPTIVVAESVLALAHMGGVGAIVGIVAGAIAYVAVDDVERLTGRDFSSPSASLASSHDTTAGQEQQVTTQQQGNQPRYSLAYRIFNGKSTRENIMERDEANHQQRDNMDTSNKREEKKVAHVTKPERLVDLSDDLTIDVDEISGKATFIVGMRRSGKTTLGVRIAEQMGRRFHLPMFIPDLEGDWLSLGDPGILPNCVIAGHPDSYNPKTGYTFAPIRTTQEAYKLGFDILEHGLQVVLDMASYGSVEEAVTLVIEVIKGIFAWTKEFPTELCPCDIYLDEAQRFLPQDLDDSIIQDSRLTKTLLKTYADILAVGGKRGLTPKILSQRIAQTNNKIMAQSEVKFIMRQTHDTDVKRCMEDVKKGVATPEQISTFAQGEGVYIAADGTQVVAHFKKRESNGSRSNTPKAATAMRYVGKTYNGPAAMTSREKALCSSPSDEGLPKRRDVTPLPQPIIPEKDNRPKAIDIDLAEAIEAFNAGATNRRKLADHFGMSETQGANLLRRIEEARTLA